MRFSEFLIPTLREDPAEAEVVSHRLMLRAGMIRRLAAGIYATLPLGERVIQKTSAIIREEMNAAGAIEVTLPFVQPAEIWHESGRWQVYGKELLRLKDRHSREFCLGPTHEEVVTDLVRGVVSSYRQLPVTLYQIHIKFRDEIRPRFGVMRAREFIMKDAYSFDADEPGAEASYERMRAAYVRIFERLGLTFRAVEADSGPIGGNFSHEFMVLADTGEDVIVCCSSCDYAANTEKAEIRPSSDSVLVQVDALPLQTVDTPGMRTIAEVGEFLSLAPDRFIKTLVLDTDSGPVVALVRGDHDINEIKLRNYLNCAELALADEAVIERVTGAPRGFAGPVGLEHVRVVADYGLQGLGNMVTGANQADAHLVNVNPGRDFTVPEWADIRLAVAGDACPRCGCSMTTTRGIEVGHIFKLGTKYSTAMQATYLDAGGTAHPMVMGCYGIGVGRTVAAAIEQSHDENGIVFPLPIAPFAVLVVLVNPTDTAQRDIAETLYRGLVAARVDVLLDDRDERPGSKFKDADLIGIPLRVTVGRSAAGEGIVDVKDRKSGDVVKIPVDGIVAHIVSWLQGRS